MSKRLMTAALTAVAVLAVAGPASATQSRINSVGGGVKQFTFLDDRNIFDLPAELVKYGTWTAIEIDGPGYTSFAIHYNFSPSVVLALYGTSQILPALTTDGRANNKELTAVGQFNNQAPGAPNTVVGGGFDAFSNGNFQTQLSHKFTALLAFDLGSARLGLKVGGWGDKHGETDDTGKETANQGPFVINVGLGAGFSIGSTDLDLGLDFRFGMATDEAGGNARSDNNMFDIALLGRITIPFAGPHEIVPFFKFDIWRAASQLKDGSPPAFSALHFDMVIGTDIRLNLGEGITVQPGIGLAYGVTTSTNKPADGDESVTTFHDVMIPFYNVAVDVKVYDWLDIRFGGGQEVHFLIENNRTGSKDGVSKSDREVKHTISTGVGFNLPAGVSIDIEVNTGWWKQGPYLLTGHAGNFGVSAALSKDW